MTKEQLSTGSYVVIGRQWALTTVFAVVVTLGGGALAFYTNDKAQDWKLSDLSRKVEKLEERAAEDQKAMAEIRSDVKVIRALLEEGKRIGGPR